VTNPYAGEVALTIDGITHQARLSLGALAELEEALGSGSLFDLIERFDQRNFSTRDVLAVLLAGLRGGGWAGQTLDLARADLRGGPVEAARVAAELLTRAFALPGES
jgi:hypothetical protein